MDIRSLKLDSVADDGEAGQGDGAAAVDPKVDAISEPK